MRAMTEPRPGPPARIRVIGRAVNAIAARAPWLWPVLRRPVAGYFNNLATGWDDRTGAGSVDHLAPLAAACERVRPAPERVLDVGTGTGAAALFLAREFPQARVRGVDFSEEMIRAANAKLESLDPEGRIAFKIADASELPYPDGHFDLLTHVNVPPFFAEVARVLAPEGHVIMVATGGSTTPFYTPEAVLKRGFARHGIEVVESGTAGR
jgi:demethylmenaquinone methyltransferase/2-methoxy-6-polyprenyl-1,4-benzoquinol methylase